MKAYRGVEVQLHALLILVLNGDDWPASIRKGILVFSKYEAR
jgi:hypothetical protein